MGVKQLWQLLQAERLMEKRFGSNPDDYPRILREVDGKVVAVDLAMWTMQADQQQALLPHFSREERCIKVAFERALQWLRHGCIPVVVVEGRAPEEKRGAQQQRFAQRTGYGGGWGAGGGAQSRGPSQFTRLGTLVASVLEGLGLPVFHAPGEAEAVCAALCQAGCVDACATFDSDVLLYGAETVYQTLKLSTTDPKTCELTKCCMADVRLRLGVASGGPAALSVLAMLAGCDYDLDGAQGVGSVGGFFLAQQLMQGDEDDSLVLPRLSALLQRPPDAHLLGVGKCTGCAQCGHEGGRKGKVKRHTRQNPCPLCPPSQDGCCAPNPGARCGCAFHATEVERRVERIAERVRRDPGFLPEAEGALAVFERQGRAAAEHVIERLQELGLPLGAKLGWLRRPSVSAVWSILKARCPGLLWDLPTLRSKMLPVLLEWDLAHPTSPQAEFAAAEIQKVHGQKSKEDMANPSHWRYVLRWERQDRDVERLGVLQVPPRKPRVKPGTGAGALEDGDDPQPLSQPLTSRQASQHSWVMDVATQAVPGEGAGPSQEGEQQPLPVQVTEFDERWMKEQPAEHRAVRQSAVRRLCPGLVEAYQERLATGAAPKRAKAKAAGTSKPGGGRKASKGGGGSASISPADAPAGGDILQLFARAVPAASGAAGSAEAGAGAGGKKGAAAPRRYGLGDSSGSGGTGAGAPSAAAAAGAGRGARPGPRLAGPGNLPPSPHAMQDLLNRALGRSSAPSSQGTAGAAGLSGLAPRAAGGPCAAGAAAGTEPAFAPQRQQQQQWERQEEAGQGQGQGRYESPRKRLKSPPASPQDRSSDGFEVLLSSPELSPGFLHPPPPLPGSAAAAATGTADTADHPRQLFSAPYSELPGAVARAGLEPGLGGLPASPGTAQQRQPQQRAPSRPGDAPGAPRLQSLAQALRGVSSWLASHAGGSSDEPDSEESAGAAAAAVQQQQQRKQGQEEGDEHEDEEEPDLQQPDPAQPHLLRKWQQPQLGARRRLRAHSQRGRRGARAPAAGGTAGRGQGLWGAEGASGGASHAQQAQRAGSPAKLPRRGKAGLRAAARVHATDIRAFLQQQAAQEEEQEQQGEDCRGDRAAAAPGSGLASHSFGTAAAEALAPAVIGARLAREAGGPGSPRADDVGEEERGGAGAGNKGEQGLGTPTCRSASGSEVVNLVTPPRPVRRSLPQGGLPAHAAWQDGQRQRPPAPGSSTGGRVIDLTGDEDEGASVG